LDLLVGGKLAARKSMSEKLIQTNGVFTWENYGRAWETDHHPIRMKFIEMMSEDSIRQTLHYRNMRPRIPYSNKCDRHADSESDDEGVE
jgi:hypothetical protein